MLIRKCFITGLFLLIFSTAYASPLLFSQRTDVHAFINEMVAKHHFSYQGLIKLFNSVHPDPHIIEKMDHPYEAKPWYLYREHFLRTDRINQGVHFWKKHAKTLARVEKQYGVPASLIVAVIGVESFYGAEKGKYPVFNTLSTLAFNYPSRAPFFQKELENYLLLTREMKINPHLPLGSYAGAMGQPQFMPSSYRFYAVDIDHDGKKDLINSADDVIASIANYFNQHGWHARGKIATPATVKGWSYLKLRNDPNHKKYSSKDFSRHGIYPQSEKTHLKKASLLILEQKKRKNSYYLTSHNFDVIKKYNSSDLYAMAVYELAQEIAANYQGYA